MRPARRRQNLVFGLQRPHHFRLRRRLVDSEVISCSRACGDADAPRLSDHGGTGARAVSWLPMRQATLESSRTRPQSARRLTVPDVRRDFPIICDFAGSHAPYRRSVDSDCTARLRRIERTAEEKISASLNRVGLYDGFTPFSFSAVQVRHGKPAPDLFLFAAEQMQTLPFAVPRDRGQHRRHRRRHRGRDARARFSRRQPLPPRLRRRPARGRGRRNVRRHAAIAWVNLA